MKKMVITGFGILFLILVLTLPIVSAAVGTTQRERVQAAPESELTATLPDVDTSRDCGFRF
jgi:hypothetical protein